VWVLATELMRATVWAWKQALAWSWERLRVDFEGQRESLLELFLEREFPAVDQQGRTGQQEARTIPETPAPEGLGRHLAVWMWELSR
jgi:hypothetical protein